MLRQNIPAGQLGFYEQVLKRRLITVLTIYKCDHWQRAAGSCALANRSRFKLSAGCNPHLTGEGTVAIDSEFDRDLGAACQCSSGSLKPCRELWREILLCDLHSLRAIRAGNFLIQSFLAYSTGFGRLFQGYPAACSVVMRPPVPGVLGRPPRGGLAG